MASNPWEILSQARAQTATLPEQYVRAKQQRLADLYRERDSQRADRKERREIEDRADEAAAFAPIDNTPPAQDYRPSAQGSKFGKLSMLAGVAPGGEAIAPLTGAHPSPPPPPRASAPEFQKVITPRDAAAMRASMGGAAFDHWKQQFGISEAEPSPAPRPDDGVAASSPSFDSAAPTAMPPVSGTAAPTAATAPGLRINPEGLQRLARRQPKLALELSRMDSDRQVAAYKAIAAQVDMEARIIGSVRSAPEDERPAVYDALRADLERKGVQGLPPVWDEDRADAHQRMGLTALEAFNVDRNDRRLANDIADDEADNARADLNTDSLIRDRADRRALTERGQNMASGDRRRGQDIADKRVRETGGRKDPASAPVIHDVKTPAQAAALPKGSYFRTPDGKVKVRP